MLFEKKTCVRNIFTYIKLSFLFHDIRVIFNVYTYLAHYNQKQKDFSSFVLVIKRKKTHKHTHTHFKYSLFSEKFCLKKA